MSLDFLLPLLTSTLGARRKPHRHVRSFLGGGSHGLLGMRGMLSLAGLAAGAYQIYRSSQRTDPATLPPVVTNRTTVVREPRADASTPPPLVPTPASGPAALTPGLQRILRLMISAARSDGVLGPAEDAQIVARAREIGAEALVARELAAPEPLARIVAGVDDPHEKEALYVLAFSIVRADSDVNGAERVFLVQLANLLNLPHARVQALEGDTSARIDASS